MSITRHEIRKISDENRGQPIISQAVIHGNVAYFAGITPNPGHDNVTIVVGRLGGPGGARS